jgi:Ca2+/Na+ antiporter
MTAHLLGNLIGRFALSYAFIWLLMFLISRLSWRHAFRRSNHWLGLVATTTTFLIGLIAAQSQGAGL